MSLTIVVTGGAGYIGGATAEMLRRRGFTPHILDNFSTSPREPAPPSPFTEVDLTDWEATHRAWRTLPPDHGVIHFAAHALVGESMAKPHAYYQNNLLAALNVARAAREFGSRWLVHSSSCAVYGTPKETPIREDFELAPVSPYGRTKVMAESILEDVFGSAKLLHLRYFNPAGALDRFGENHDPETHLIPNAVKAALTGEAMEIYGEDYPTPDGTCLRDFIHLEDLAEAHLAAMDALESSALLPRSLNLGAGRPVSVREVLRQVEAVTGKKVPFRLRPRRPGDPPALFADIQLAAKHLKWQPKQTLEQAVRSHVEWVRKHASPTL